MCSQQSRWNHRYNDDTFFPEPAWVLLNHAMLLPADGVALDLACGLGANAVFLAQHDLKVNAWDISDAAISRLNRECLERRLDINAQVRDIEANPPETGRFDIICVTRYLHRPLCEAISKALKPGGLLYYQTFTRAGVPHRLKGPTNPDFLLEEGELPRLFPQLKVLTHIDESDYTDQRQGLEGQACMIARQQK